MVEWKEELDITEAEVEMDSLVFKILSAVRTRVAGVGVFPENDGESTPREVGLDASSPSSSKASRKT